MQVTQTREIGHTIIFGFAVKIVDLNYFEVTFVLVVMKNENISIFIKEHSSLIEILTKGNYLRCSRRRVQYKCTINWWTREIRRVFRFDTYKQFFPKITPPPPTRFAKRSCSLVDQMCFMSSIKRTCQHRIFDNFQQHFRSFPCSMNLTYSTEIRPSKNIWVQE